VFCLNEQKNTEVTISISHALTAVFLICSGPLVGVEVWGGICYSCFPLFYIYLNPKTLEHVTHFAVALQDPMDGY